MNRERFLLAVSILTLVIFTVVALVYRDFVRENIVIPIYYLGWVITLVVRSIPQSLCLLGLVVIGLVMAAVSLPRIRKPVLRKGVHGLSAPGQSRYAFWLRLCRQMRQSTFFLDDISADLRRFLLIVLAYQEHRDMLEVEEMIVQGTLDVPPVVCDLTIDRHLGGSEGSTGRGGLIARLWERLSGNAALRQSAALNKRNQHLEQIIIYLEERLEVHRDRDNR